MAAEKIDALELNIESKLSVENLDKLVDSLRKLGKEVDKVKDRKPKQAIKDVGDGASEASKGIDSFLGKTVRVAAVIALFSKAGDAIGDCISKVLTYDKTLNMFTVSLGEYATNATKYAQTVSDALGIDIAGWQQTQGIFQTLITGFGVGGDQAAYMSQNLTQLSYDIASFYNLTNEEAANKIKSAIAGRLEPIRKLGYDLSQSKLVDIAKNPANYGKQTYSINEQTGAIEANTTAIDDNTQHKIVNFNQLTQQEKVQLRYIALMTQVTQVQGNFSRALNDPASQMKIFKEQMEMTARALGSVFIPALNQVLPYLTAFTQLVGDAFRSLASWFGYEIPDMSDRMNIADTVQPYNDVVKATGAAASNAKKLKDYTIGLDELNVLKKPDSTGGGGGSAGGQQSNLSNLLTPGYDFLSQALNNSIKTARKNLEKLRDDLKAHPLQVSWEIFSSGAGELGSKIWELILGKTPEELAAEANAHGRTVFDEFYIGLGYRAGEPGSKLVELIFGSPEDLATRAKNAGRTVGEQFGLELLKKSMEAVQATGGSWIYKIVSGGHDLNEDIAKINKAIENAGEQSMKSYADGITKGQDYVKTASNEVFKKSLDGVTDNGNANKKFYNTSADEARKYGEGLASGQYKAFTAGYGLSKEGASGSAAYKGSFKSAGEQSGQGFVGGIDKFKVKSTKSGQVIAENALKKLKQTLGIHSPSKVMEEQGYYTDVGFANGIEKYAYLAENASKAMASATVSAVNTAGAYTTSNVGYGVGVANQGSMMNLASNIYNAVVSGIAGLNTGNKEMVVTCDGKVLFKIVNGEARKSGVQISNGAFAM